MTEITIEQWKQANLVYSELMDLTVSDALNQLSQMNDLDDGLKSLVLTLISSGNQPSQYFKQQVGTSFKIEASSYIEFKPGDQVDGYELLEEIGSGGMAKVYKAMKINADSPKPVAIKLFNRGDVSSILQSRFAIEQEVLSGLSHPNIVNMHHGGTSGDGVPYIVMDLIEQAQDIDEYAITHQASLKQIVKWVLSAAKAIAYAHNNLIVHRDIKPSNLLIDDSGRLKVVDFGIAKLMTQEDSPQKTTIMALTPSFAAPEQINSGHISVTTDVFSLAAVCLALILRELPLPADRMLKSCLGDEEHIWQLLKTRVKDNDLRNILNHALQQDPVKRYSSMGLFVDDLSAWLSNRPVMATPDSRLYRIKKFAMRRRALFAALSTLLLMFVLGIVLLSWQVDKTRTEARKANEVKDFMLGVFSVVNPDEAMGEKILAKDLLSQAVAEIQSKDFKSLATKSELLVAMGQAQLQLGLNQPAKASFAAALAVNPNLVLARLGELKIILAEGDFSAAVDKITRLNQLMDDDSMRGELLLLQSDYSINHLKDYQLARSQAQRAQDIFDTQQNFIGHLNAARTLANIMYIQSEPLQAASYLEQQLVKALKQLAPTHTVILAIRNDLIDLYNDVGDFKQSIKHSSQLITEIVTVLGEQHPFLIEAYISQAGIYRATGEIDAAKTSAKLALDLSRQLNGEKHQSTARAVNFIGVLHYVDGNIDLALESMQHAASLYEQSLGEDHPETWEIKTNLTAILNILGRYDEAVALLEPVYKKQVAILGVGHKSVIYSQTILSRLYADVGRLGEAQIMAEAMLAQAKSELGFDHPLTAGGYFSLAKIYQQQENYPAAIELINTVIASESWDDNNERAIGTYNTLADLYADNNESLLAMKFKEKSLAIASKVLSEDSPRTLTQMLNNFEFYLATGDQEKASVVAAKLTGIFSRIEAPNEKLLSRFELLKAGLEAFN